ncbi:MAG: hypothetical protein GY737_24775 [Desulfobacteraceae bacterium]|nr:hypothetical protein [Desulfobacteraceae bacterium]
MKKKGSQTLLTDQAPGGVSIADPDNGFNSAIVRKIKGADTPIFTASTGFKMISEERYICARPPPIDKGTWTDSLMEET